MDEVVRISVILAKAMSHGARGQEMWLSVSWLLATVTDIMATSTSNERLAATR
jgi:hypothetical protein